MNVDDSSYVAGIEFRGLGPFPPPFLSLSFLKLNGLSLVADGNFYGAVLRLIAGF